MNKRRALIAVGLVAATAAGVAWWWHQQRQEVAPAAVGAAATQGCHVRIYRAGWFGADELVYDLVATDGGTRRVDAIHAFVAAAEQLQGTEFRHVVLARGGQPRFRLEGEYVRQLGRERAFQNSVYTVRTFPEHVRRLDGSAPWPPVHGGLLGVLGVQMENVNSFLDEWLH